MRHLFSHADFDQLADLWNRVCPPKYGMDAHLLRDNTVESPLFDWGASFIEMDGERPSGFVSVKKSANPTLFRGPDPDGAHINAIVFERPEVGVDLLAAAKRVLRERGVYRLAFGQDSRHFFPGCPMDCPSLRDFLIIEGFDEGHEEVDLERDLRDYTPPEGSLAPLGGFEAVTEGFASVKPIGERGHPDPLACIVHEADVPLLDEFLEREFPGRWRHDVMDKVKREGSSAGIVGLFERGHCQGFALTQTWKDKHPIGGAVWRKDLGEHWGSLGPIGVSKAVRGRGLGNALLGAGLMSLKQRGARRTIIDWTTLVDFYGGHGFAVNRRYKTFALRLDRESPGPTGS